MLSVLVTAFTLVYHLFQLGLKMTKGYTNPTLYIVGGTLPLNPSKRSPVNVFPEAEFVLLRESYSCELWEERLEGSFVQKCRSVRKNRLRSCSLHMRRARIQKRPSHGWRCSTAWKWHHLSYIDMFIDLRCTRRRYFDRHLFYIGSNFSLIITYASNVH